MGTMPASPKTKPKTEAEICALADARIREVLKTHGPELPDEEVLSAFSQWVLPDRHLTLIRERIERWRGVAAKRASKRSSRDSKTQ